MNFYSVSLVFVFSCVFICVSACVCERDSYRETGRGREAREHRQTPAVCKTGDNPVYWSSNLTLPPCLKQAQGTAEASMPGSLHRHTGVIDGIRTPVFLLTQQALFTLWAISSALGLLFETFVVQLCKQSNVIRPHYPALFLAYISSSMFNTYFPFPYYIKENCAHRLPSVNIVGCTFRSCVPCCKIQPCHDEHIQREFGNYA